MLTEFLYVLPAFLFSVFALLHISELTGLLGGVEQAAFFAARADFVGGDVDRAVRGVEISVLSPARADGARDSRALQMRWEKSPEDFPTMKVGLPYPDLVPYSSLLFARGEGSPACVFPGPPRRDAPRSQRMGPTGSFLDPLRPPAEPAMPYLCGSALVPAAVAP